MDAVEKLLAIHDLKSLKARYFELVDGKRWEEWKELFEPDLVAEFPDEPPGFAFHGRDNFVPAIQAALGDALTIHHGHTPQIEILSETTAKAVWTMQDILRWPEGVALPQGVRNLEGWGHYHETYKKSDAGWRIATLKLTRVHVVKY